MTPAEREEYEWRLSLRNACRAEVREALGYTDAPAQPHVHQRAWQAPPPESRTGHDRSDALL